MPCADDYNGQSFCYGNVKTFGRELQKRDQREFVAAVVGAWHQQLVQQFQAGAKAFLGNSCDAGNASPACMAANGFYDYLNSGPQQDSQLRRLVLSIIGDKEAVRDSGGVNAIIAGIATLPLGGEGFVESLLGRGGAEAASATVTKTVGETIAGAAVGDSRALAVAMLKELAEAGSSQLAQNVARGKVGNMLMEAALKDAGFSNVTSEVTFKTLAGVRFRADFVARLGGRTFVFESKTGGALLSAGQQAGYEALLNGEGLIPIGARAASFFGKEAIGGLNTELDAGQAWWALGG